MYDRPETAAAHDALWSLVRKAHGGDLPISLTRGMVPAETWAHPALVLGQICGLPLRREFRDRVLYVGSGIYDIDAPPGHYVSLLVARADDPRTALADFDGARLAVNGTDSQSGWASPLTAAAAAGITFGARLETGVHALSARAVREGRADIAAIDAISWRAILRHDPAAAGLRSVGTTAPVPGLAFVTAPGGDPDRMFGALTEAIAALPDTHRNTLGLRGIVRLPLESYHAVPTPPSS
jgi:ABC-type phosphate/phosphonate transport system substrate-binding protein